MNPRIVRFVALSSFSLAALAGAAFVACSSSTSATSGDAGSSSSSSSSGSSSGACALVIAELPAIVTVVSSTGAPIPCDATLSIVGDDAGAGTNTFSCSAGVPYLGCPDAGATCAYGVRGVGVTTYTVDVSQPGFVSQTVQVTTGETNCSGTTPPTNATVTLVPSEDGGSDSGSDSGDASADASDSG